MLTLKRYQLGRYGKISSHVRRDTRVCHPHAGRGGGRYDGLADAGPAKSPAIRPHNLSSATQVEFEPFLDLRRFTVGGARAEREARLSGASVESDPDDDGDTVEAACARAAGATSWEEEDEAREPPDAFLYRLCGVVVHQDMLNSCHFGHYIAFVRRAEQWYLMDDEEAAPVEWAAVAAQKAYMLFYQKVVPPGAPAEEEGDVTPCSPSCSSNAGGGSAHATPPTSPAGAAAARPEAPSAAPPGSAAAGAKEQRGGLHKFDADEVDVEGGDASAEDFLGAFGFDLGDALPDADAPRSGSEPPAEPPAPDPPLPAPAAPAGSAASPSAGQGVLTPEYEIERCEHGVEFDGRPYFRLVVQLPLCSCAPRSRTEIAPRLPLRRCAGSRSARSSRVERLRAHVLSHRAGHRRANCRRPKRRRRAERVQVDARLASARPGSAH